jgi:hypothetical protein
MAGDRIAKRRVGSGQRHFGVAGGEPRASAQADAQRQARGQKQSRCGAPQCSRAAVGLFCHHLVPVWIFAWRVSLSESRRPFFRDMRKDNRV